VGTNLELATEQSKSYLRQRRIVEIIVVLAFLYLPSIGAEIRNLDVASVAPLGPRGQAEYLYGIFIECARVALILYLLWSSNESFSEFGFTKPKPSDLFWAIPLTVFAFGLNLVNSKFYLHQSSFAPSSNLASWFPSLRVFVPYVLASAVVSEIVFRSYLIRRLEQIGWKSLYAVLFSAALYTGGHLYEQTSPLVYVAIVGLLYGAFFARFKKIWPLIIAHFCVNLITYWQMFQWLHQPIKF
jgi:uncharacterized protein